MKKWFLIVIFFCMIVTIASAEEKRILQETIDVTGDGVPEKIYIVINLPAGNSVYKKIRVEQKTANGWKNIFPEKFPFERMDKEGYRYNPEIGNLGKMEFGYVADKFDANYPGLQILVYWFDKWGNEENIVGYFFKKEPKDDNFKLYRADLTDKKYPRLYSPGKMPNYKRIVTQEFKNRKTLFTKSFETAKRFFELLQKSRWQEAKAMCSGAYCEARIDAIKEGRECKINKINTFELHQWDFRLEDKGIDFFSGISTGSIDITVDNNQKICDIQTAR